VHRVSAGASVNASHRLEKGPVNIPLGVEVPAWKRKRKMVAEVPATQMGEIENQSNFIDLFIFFVTCYLSIHGLHILYRVGWGGGGGGGGLFQTPDGVGK